MTKYYSLDNLKKQKDINGNEPYFYMITGNRSAGKTTALLLESLKLHKESGKQVLFLYRVKDEIGAVGEIYKDVLQLYPEYGITVETKKIVHGIVARMLLTTTNGEQNILGFAVALNDCDKLKKYSSIFVDVELIVFDEYQLENGKYLKDEIQKLQSVIFSVSRGGGKQSRPVKTYLLGNTVTLMNPYFIFFGIHKRLRDNTHFLRGDRWVAEFEFNKAASDAIDKNPMSAVFKGSNYVKYSKENVYLSDSSAFIDKATGKSNYLFTIIQDNESYAVREYYEQGIVFVDKTVDAGCPNVVTFDSASHNQNTLMLSTHAYIFDYLNNAYKLGLLRFKDLKCKNIILDILSITLL